MNNEKKDLTIVISSPESYRDVFDIFVEFFNKNWPECPYRKVYVTDFIKDANAYKGFEVFTFPEEKDWFSRTKQIIKEIDTEFVMIIADDLFIVRHIFKDTFDELLRFMDEKKYVYCRLVRSKHIRKHNKKISSNNIFNIKYSNPYGRNLLGAIWNTEHFADFLANVSCDPWKTEEKWGEEALTKGNLDIASYCYLDNNFFCHAVYKGEWMPKAKRTIKKQGLQFNSRRKTINFKTSLIMFAKDFLRERISYKRRIKLKRKFSKHIHFDTKY